jgi:hypothetical protein
MKPNKFHNYINKLSKFRAKFKDKPLNQKIELKKILVSLSYSVLIASIKIRFLINKVPKSLKENKEYKHSKSLIDTLMNRFWNLSRMRIRWWQDNSYSTTMFLKRT